MASRGHAHAPRWLTALAVVAAAVVALPTPAPQLPLLLVHAAALLVVLTVLVRRQLAGRRVTVLRWALAAVVALVGAGAGADVLVPGSGADRVLVLAAQTTACLLAAWSVLRRRAAVRGSAGEPGTWPDVTLAVVGTGVGVGAALSAATAAGVPPLTVATLGADVVVLASVTWFWLSREGLSRAAHAVLAAGVLYPLYDLVTVLAGAGAPVAGLVGRLLAAVAVVLVTAAATSTSLAGLGDRGFSGRPRRGSARMLLVLPAAAVPPLAWAVGLAWPAASLPGWVLLLGGDVITALALWRALQLLLDAEEAAGLDPLTGLLDRRGLLRELDGWVGARRDAWLCLIDLDDFKLVNDQRGHEAGDALLVAVAERLVHELPQDATVARLGGDELVVLVVGPSPDAVATRVLDVFSRPFALSGEGEAVRISASLGVTELSPDTSAAAALVCADVAMYVAKRRGRDRWVAYDPSLREQVLGAGQVQRELRILLHEGDPGASAPADAADRAAAGALVVHYQPVMDLVTGLPSGVEALVRWHHPRRGLVPPDSFLALAEAAGLGPALDHWVLHQALHQMAGWDAAGLVGLNRVAVNLGVSSVRSPSLGEDVAVALRASGMTPDRLLLEITEHDELQADRAAAECLLGLRDAGVTIALDDFGAGYASIGYLRRWPVNLIKLDRSLLPRAVEEGAFEAVDDPAELLDGVAALAGALGHALVAEGIETEDDERAVRAVGVRYAQGWLYSRALPPDELAAWWQENSEAPRVPAPRSGDQLEGAR